MDSKINNQLSTEDALTPLDGRNRHKLKTLTPFFSDRALNYYRAFIEIEYLKALSSSGVIRKFSNKELDLLTSLLVKLQTRDETGLDMIRQIEKKTNHDVKAVELYLQLNLQNTTLNDITSMVHFGLTSDDINNCAYALMIKHSIQQVIIPSIEKIIEKLSKLIQSSKDIPMLGRTHGQPAAPTTLGKELLVFYQRLVRELAELKKLNIKAKLNGNTGNFNVHKLLLPKTNWLEFSQKFIKTLGLTPDLVTTQIEPYDSLISIFSSLSKINNILLGLCQDLWQYIMLGYFQQQVIKTETGSTALPHKTNPIYFEGAEGGFGIANALLEFYCRKLSYSRLQRDLSDSTVRRSFGIAFGYSLLSYQSVEEGLKRITPNKKVITADLNKHIEILSEPIQNLLRLRGKIDAYEQAKKFFRGKEITVEQLRKFIMNLDLNKEDKKILLDLTPEKYTGYAEKIVKLFL